MVTKLDLEKNILNLSYRRNLQLLNIVLILGVGTVLAYAGSIILNPEKILSYTFATILVGAITYILYRNIDSNLNNISIKIKNLFDYLE